MGRPRLIVFRQGNLIEAPVEALVNTVNTVGAMGKGRIPTTRMPE